MDRLIMCSSLMLELEEHPKIKNLSYLQELMSWINVMNVKNTHKAAHNFILYKNELLQITQLLTTHQQPSEQLSHIYFTNK
jgi:hypothetical protein